MPFARKRLRRQRMSTNQAREVSFIRAAEQQTSASIRVTAQWRPTDALRHTGEVATTGRDRETILVIVDRLGRRIKWRSHLMQFEIGLGIVAVMAACVASPQLLFIAWAVLEIGLVWRDVAACRSWKEVLYWLQIDMASGVVRESVGRVQASGVFFRVVVDSGTGDKYLMLAPAVPPSSVSLGSEVVFRAAIRSRIVLSLRPLADD